MQHISGTVFFSIVESVIRIFGQIQDIILLECQYSIFGLVQNVLPADTNLQTWRYQEYSNKLYYSVNTIKQSKSALLLFHNDAHDHKITGILKQLKIPTVAPTCFFSRRNHHQGAIFVLS
jgi:hypothetical protein